MWNQLAFRHPWRAYQARILAALDAHLEDGRLHIVAAPGSGKTILGLEVFRRLERRTLVLSPTRTIRDQWIQRLEEFLPAGHAPSEVAATTLAEGDRLLYSMTYQALHHRGREIAETVSPTDAENGPDEDGPDENGPDEDGPDEDGPDEDGPDEDGPDEDGPDEDDPNQDPPDAGEAAAPEASLVAGATASGDESSTPLAALVADFKAAGIGLIVLDEAHHLHSAWWTVLSALVAEFDDMRLVSLTATPPLDLTESDWSRYSALCGPIDDQIAVPELVRTGTLCPHQDYVYILRPSREESDVLARHDERVRETLAAAVADGELVDCVERHPLLHPPAQADALLAEPELAFALLSLLAAANRPLPEDVLRLLAITFDEVPAFERRWLARLLQAFIGDRDWRECDGRAAARDRWKGYLREQGLLYRNRLDILGDPKTRRALTESSAKIRACQEIHAIERGLRGESLRQVILTDYIRDEALFDATDEEMKRLGAWPVFEAIARASDDATQRHMAMLTGRVAIIHRALLDPLQAELGVSTARAVPTLANFVALTGRDRRLVGVATRWLERGRLRLVVGTRSLLGEGWDAPSINSLVLASYVGAYVATNQMRGRAIRRDAAAPEKHASLWHIAAVEPGLEDEGYADIDDLAARFDTFVGLDAKSARIESGFRRLHLEGFYWTATGLKAQADRLNNRAMQWRLQRDRDTLAVRWHEAIEGGTLGSQLPVASTPAPPRFIAHLFVDHRRLLWLQATWLISSSLAVTLQYVKAPPKLGGLALILAVGLSVGVVRAAPRLCRLATLCWRHRSPARSLLQIARAVRDALGEAGLIREATARAPIHRQQSGGAETLVGLSAGEHHERALFADAMAEVLGVVANPRYLVAREGERIGRHRRDWYAVPQVLGENRGLADIFRRHWVRHMGKADLVFTRQEGGRIAILEARARSLANATAAPAGRRDVWS